MNGKALDVQSVSTTLWSTILGYLDSSHTAGWSELHGIAVLTMIQRRSVEIKISSTWLQGIFRSAWWGRHNTDAYKADPIPFSFHQIYSNLNIPSLSQPYPTEPPPSQHAVQFHSQDSRTRFRAGCSNQRPPSRKLQVPRFELVIQRADREVLQRVNLWYLPSRPIPQGKLAFSSESTFCSIVNNGIWWVVSVLIVDGSLEWGKFPLLLPVLRHEWSILLELESGSSTQVWIEMDLGPSHWV